MSRLLANLPLDQLRAMAERNWDKAGELDLILLELRHRNTHAASKLRERVEMWVQDCKRDAPTPGAKAPVPEPEKRLPQRCADTRKRATGPTKRSRNFAAS